MVVVEFNKGLENKFFNLEVVKILVVHYNVFSLQQKVSLYTKWFQWILREFIGCNEQGLMKKQRIH
jgi:hypothetical protein